MNSRLLEFIWTIGEPNVTLKCTFHLLLCLFKTHTEVIGQMSASPRKLPSVPASWKCPCLVGTQHLNSGIGSRDLEKVNMRVICYYVIARSNFSDLIGRQVSSLKIPCTSCLTWTFFPTKGRFFLDKTYASSWDISTQRRMSCTYTAMGYLGLHSSSNVSLCILLHFLFLFVLAF